jgi:MinD superfamily P-loop ATPase
MKIVILSGKGGVGKSSIAASLAVIMAENSKVVCADCDVDTSNLSLLFGLTTADYAEWKPISTNEQPEIGLKKCVGCGQCTSECHFKALSLEGKPVLDTMACEGCGVCQLVCPADAIRLMPVYNAMIGHAVTDSGIFVSSAQLSPGSSGSGKIVSLVKERTIMEKHDIMIIDSAAGIGCPVIASVSGADHAVLVTEPTQAAFSDMKRALGVIKHFRLGYDIIINKSDLDPHITRNITEFAEANNSRILACIPFDRAFASAMVKMKPIVAYQPRYRKIFEEISGKLM